MTRRIALSVLALVVALLALAVVPLGISITDRQHDAFWQETASRARGVAAAAEENLVDHRPDTEALDQIAEAAEHGDCAQVYGIEGAQLFATPCEHSALPPSAVPAVLGDGHSRSAQSGGWLSLAVPVGDTATPSGALVYSRPTADLERQFLEVWGWLGLCAFGALGASMLVAVRLARWVGRPVEELDQAAARLGDGDLAARAQVTQGPPEVRRLATTFNSMAARTQNLIHGHRAVIADVSHQLRTPLTALRLRLDLLAADAGDDSAQELAGAQEEIARLSRMVDGLLAVARAENAVPRQTTVDVDEVVADRIAAWQPVAQDREVTLSARGPKGLTAWIGPGDLEQVLDNLIANGLDMVPHGGLVQICTARQPGLGEIMLSVVDNGPGMDAEARERAFRRFDTGRESGTGLGLAIVHRLVTAGGGRVALEPTPGGGLTVRLWLPAGRPPQPSPRRGTTWRPHRDHPKGSSQTRKNQS